MIEYLENQQRVIKKKKKIQKLFILIYKNNFKKFYKF
jgi:hypothetical protein